MKIYRLSIAITLIISILLSVVSCTQESGSKPKNSVITGAFDTVSVIYDYSGGTQESFDRTSGELFELLHYYHRLFDIYNTYDGINNIATINSMAGKGAVEVCADLIDFLEYSVQMHALTDGYVNIAMGAVLSIWHEHRTEGINNPIAAVVPSEAELLSASEHCNISDLIIDRENMTVELVDPEMSLDVGAIAKGYATERLADYLTERGISSYALDIGGNLRVVGTKPSGEGWKTGIKNPIDANGDHVKIFYISDCSAVTSGGYERYYFVGGKSYHHIIDKDTLMPASHFASVSVICRDSGLADALSTALFCMKYDDGAALVESLSDIEVVWVFNDGSVKNIVKSKQ